MSLAQEKIKSSIAAIHIGMSGFPVGSAAVNKFMAVYKSLHQHGVDFLIINNRAFHQQESSLKLNQRGVHDGMNFCYTSLSPYKSNSFLGRRVSNMVGRWREFWLLVKLGSQKKIDVAFYYPTNGSFLELIYYRLISKVFRFKIIAHYVEYRTAFDHTDFPIELVADQLFDRYFMKWVDAVLPISEFLIKHLQSRGYRGPLLKVPPLADFNKFNSNPSEKFEKYFFYVGSASYMEAIDFIIRSFEKINSKDVELHLVVNGNADQMAEFNQLIQSSAASRQIKCFSNLSYPDLIKKYMEASALLIPLTSSVQDSARFPQKMAEYLASAKPVITTNFGEVPYYLQDGVNALICNSYDVDLFSQKMKWVTDHPEEAKAIGVQGKEIGLKYFDFNSYGQPIRNLIDSLILNP